MNYQKIEQTIVVRGSKEELPVSVGGEVTVSANSIASDPDAKQEQVHELATELQDAIDEVLERRATVKSGN